MTKICLILLLVFAPDLLSPAHGQSWSLEKNSKQIQVYTRAVEASDIKEFKAVTTIAADMPRISDLILAVETHPDWMDRVIASRLVSEGPEFGSKRLIYYAVQFPFPFKKRDLVVETSSSFDQTNFQLDISGSPAAVPPIDGFIRIPIVKGFWQLESLSEENTKVTYQFHSDDGSNLPAWLINLFIVKSPYETLKTLKNICEN